MTAFLRHFQTRKLYGELKWLLGLMRGGSGKWLPMVQMVSVPIHLCKYSKSHLSTSKEWILCSLNEVWKTSLFLMASQSCFHKACNHFIFLIFETSYHFIYEYFSIHLKNSYPELLPLKTLICNILFSQCLTSNLVFRLFRILLRKCAIIFNSYWWSLRLFQGFQPL